MPVLDDIQNHPAESANQANFRVIDGKPLGASDGVGSPSLAAFAKPSRAHPCEADLCFLDLEQFEAEDRLGCVRGVLWSLVFEAALATLAVLYWKFHFFSH
jgi:hypothetical protein